MRKILPLLSLLLVGCTSYIRTLPTFPECVILRLNVPQSMIVGTEYDITCWTNAAPDSVIIAISFINPVDKKEIPVWNQRWKTENHENAPVLGPTWVFAPPYEATFVFDFVAKNRWSQDYYRTFSRATDWTRPRGIPGPGGG